MSTKYKIELRAEDYENDDVQTILKNCGLDDTWVSEEDDNSHFITLHAPTRALAAWVCEALVIDEINFEFSTSDW